MNICIGHWESTTRGFVPETASDNELEREANAQRATRSGDLRLGVHSVEEFERAYNADEAGEYSLDPAFYWIRFTGGEE